MFGPVDVSESEVIDGVDVAGFGFHDEAEVLLGEFFLGEVGELVDADFVGVVVVGVVGVDFGEAFEEDFFSVGVFECGLEGEAVLGLEGFEL